MEHNQNIAKMMSMTDLSSLDDDVPRMFLPQFKHPFYAQPYPQSVGLFFVLNRLNSS